MNAQEFRAEMDSISNAHDKLRERENVARKKFLAANQKFQDGERVEVQEWDGKPWKPGSVKRAFVQWDCVKYTINKVTKGGDVSEQVFRGKRGDIGEKHIRKPQEPTP